MPFVKQTQTGVTLTIKLVPRASRDEVMGPEGDALKIRLTAPPVEGAANAALIAFLARVLAVPKAQVTLLHGETSRHKTVAIRGRTATEVESILGKGRGP
jgi:hypothetical protein